MPTQPDPSLAGGAADIGDVAAASPSRIYYGWWMVVLGALAMVATLPGRTHGLGLVTEPLLADLEIGRIAYAQLNLWATLLGAAFCLPCGWLIDRFGSRWILTGVLVGLAGVVLAMSQVETLAWLFLYVTLTRGLGQSMLSVASITLIGKWFTHRLPLAMGVYSLLIGVGFALAFKSVGYLVLAYDWRMAWAVIGLVLIGFAILAWLLVRDGGSESTAGQAGSNPQRETVGSATLRQALSTSSFWIFGLATSIYGMVSSGLSLFNESVLAERGFPASTYHSVLAVSSITGMCLNLFGGWMATRWSLGGVLALAMFLFSTALLALPYVQTSTHVYLYAITLGAAGGIVTVVFFSVWGHAFGRRHLGKIQGVAQMLTVLASAAGPLVLAECHARTGSYMPAFYVLAPLTILLGFLAWLVPLPNAAGGRWDTVDPEPSSLR